MTPEFSRLWDITKVETDVVLVANEAERAAVAERLGLVGLHQLEGTMRLKRLQDGRIGIHGQFSAKAEQECVVTLEPVPASLSGEIDEIIREGEDDEDLPVLHGQVDLGELLVQCFSLALEPYPRKPGIAFEGFEVG
jgi:uncharacterized metal-binding protein YceD (DUF177 family)